MLEEQPLGVSMNCQRVGVIEANEIFSFSLAKWQGMARSGS